VPDTEPDAPLIVVAAENRSLPEGAAPT
jgi:hypothetical protein